MEGPVVLLMGRRQRIGGLAAQAEALLDLEQAPTVVALAGRSAAALAELQEVSAKFPGRLLPMGFTDRVPALMRAADLVVTKPGDCPPRNASPSACHDPHVPIPGRRSVTPTTCWRRARP